MSFVVSAYISKADPSYHCDHIHCIQIVCHILEECSQLTQTRKDHMVEQYGGIIYISYKTCFFVVVFFVSNVNVYAKI